MPFYTGKGSPGSDDFEMEEFEGVYINPDNEDEFSSEPYPSQVKAMRDKKELLEYMGDKYSLDDVYSQIQNKECELPVRLRKYVISHYDDKGNFIK